jgi:hypothetical protein
MNQLCLVLFVAFSAGAANAQTDEGDANYKHYSALRKVSTPLFISAMQKFGPRIWTAAALQACDKAGIADSVAVSPDEKAEYLWGEVKRLKVGTDENAQTLRGLSSDETFNLIGAVTDQTLAYAVGYQHAIETAKDSAPALCSAAVQKADKILKERAAK